MQVNIEIYGIEFSASFNYSKAEPMVMYDRNGEGHPGSPAEIYDIEIDHRGTDFTDLFYETDKMEKVENLIWEALAKEADNY